MPELRFDSCNFSWLGAPVRPDSCNACATRSFLPSMSVSLLYFDAVMDRYVFTRSSQATQQNIQTTQGSYHAVGSRRLAAAVAASETPEPFSSAADDNDDDDDPDLYHDSLTGLRFRINFDRLWHGRRKLDKRCVGIRLKHKSQLQGKREVGSIWRYGAELELKENNGEVKTLWLCKACHVSKREKCCWIIDGYNHVKMHLLKHHRVNADQGLLPEPTLPSDPFEATSTAAAAARRPIVAGSRSVVNHTPWQEDKLMESYIDWVVANDVSFRLATDPSTRGLLTWNRTALLRCFPNSASTLSKYVVERLEEKKKEIRTLLHLAESKISVSCDLWASPNNMDFLAVVAHFVGESSDYPIQTSACCSIS